MKYPTYALVGSPKILQNAPKNITRCFKIHENNQSSIKTLQKHSKNIINVLQSYKMKTQNTAKYSTTLQNSIKNTRKSAASFQTTSLW